MGVVRFTGTAVAGKGARVAGTFASGGTGTQALLLLLSFLGDRCCLGQGVVSCAPPSLLLPGSLSLQGQSLWLRG